MKTNELYDIFIIGGGINGCGVARDAAGRGFSVCLAEKEDFAGATSSGSTKLIHGGLRYLEYYEFRLVRKALVEREVLWRIAPHITGIYLLTLRYCQPRFKHSRFAQPLHCFVKLGNLYARPGQESLLFRLLESILAHHKTKTALIFHDPRSLVFRRIAGNGRFGMLNAGINVKVHIMAAQVGLTKKQSEALQDKPVVISPMDIG